MRALTSRERRRPRLPCAVLSLLAGLVGLAVLRRGLRHPGLSRPAERVLATPLQEAAGVPAAAAMQLPAAAAAAATTAWPCSRFLAEGLAAGGRHTRVSTAAALQPALDAAGPGDVIELADGTYAGMWAIDSSAGAASGRPGAPITLCGSGGAVLRGPSQRMNQTAVLTLAGMRHWRVAGLVIENGYKAVWGQVRARSSAVPQRVCGGDPSKRGAVRQSGRGAGARRLPGMSAARLGPCCRAAAAEPSPAQPSAARPPRPPCAPRRA